MNNKRILAQVFNQPWLISSSGLDLVCQVAAREGDIAAVLAKRGETPAGSSKRLQIRGKVAVLAINGPIFRFANLFSDISGATSVDDLARDFQTAMDDPMVETIIPYFGSPGGQAAGIHELANMIRQASEKKHVVGYVHEMAASAGYWLAAGCEELVVDKTALLGSIGVVIGFQKDNGDRTIEFVSDCSPKKRLDPQTEEGRAEIMDRANSLAQVFVASVAEFRGVSVDTVLANFGQGGVLIGEQAVAVGMADRTGSLEGLIAEFNKPVYMPRPMRSELKPAASAAQNISMEVSQMNKEELTAKYPEACQQIFDDGKAAGIEEVTPAVTTAKLEGQGESERILGLLAIHAGEEEAKAFGSVVHTGVTVEQFKAIRGTLPAAAKAGDDTDAAFKANMLDGIKKAGAANPGAATDDLGKDRDFATMVADHMDAKGCKKGEAMRAMQQAHPKAHAAWLRDQQK